jgi:2-polyprenyl-3-methyl-5-hydroxy-6-metoxy-1,4-benzoquinol methylase
MVSYANSDVLNFYKQLPFNLRSSPNSHIEEIKKNPVTAYPVIIPHLKKNIRVLEVGCGVGWLANSMAYHYGSNVTAIDFNNVAIERANEVKHILGTSCDFQQCDLFEYMPSTKFDMVVSIGVLHHTDNAIFGLEHIFQNCLKPGGYALIGLYHKYGRKPFIDHFMAMKQKGAKESELLFEYKRLHSTIGDEVQLNSWFRDQVLHPHETQHTLFELLPYMDKHNVKLISTSINKFKPFKSFDEIKLLEIDMEKIGLRKLKDGEYYPGFFVFLAQKKDLKDKNFISNFFSRLKQKKSDVHPPQDIYPMW